jgi:hypothetical protein
MSNVELLDVSCRYQWLRNGEPLNLNLPNIKLLAEGTIEILQASILDEGYYQCLAENQYGTAVSNVIRLQRAVFSTDGTPNSVADLTVYEGEPFSLAAVPPKCFPKPSFVWEVARVIDNHPVALSLSARMQIADNGKSALGLHFRFFKF